MPNFPNPFLLLSAEHLIYWFLMKFIIKLNKEKYRKNKIVSSNDVKTNSGLSSILQDCFLTVKSIGKDDEELVGQNLRREPHSSIMVRRFRKQKSCCHVIAIPSGWHRCPNPNCNARVAEGWKLGTIITTLPSLQQCSDKMLYLNQMYEKKATARAWAFASTARMERKGSQNAIYPS